MNFSIVETTNNFIKIKFSGDYYYLYIVDDLALVKEQLNSCKSISCFRKVVCNVSNSFYTAYDGCFYVLFKEVYYKFNNEYLFNGYLSTNNYTHNFDWKILWCNKIDYLQYIYKYNDSMDSSILYAFDYYMSLGELAISILDRINFDVSLLCISYINYDNRLFTSPLNTKIDIAERNVAEYFRIIFYNGEYLNFNFSSFFFKYRYIYNYSLILTRLIFPHNFFCLIDKMFYFNINIDNEIKKIINKIDDFEMYIHYICVEMKKYQYIDIDI